MEMTDQEIRLYLAGGGNAAWRTSVEQAEVEETVLADRIAGERDDLEVMEGAVEYAVCAGQMDAPSASSVVSWIFC